MYTSNVSPRLLLGVFAAAISALIFGLWMMIKSTSSEAGHEDKAVAAPAHAQRTETVAPSPDAPAAAARKAALPTIVKDRKPPSAPATDTSASTPSPPAPAPDPAEAKRMQLRGLLKSQVVATESQMIDCMDKAGKGVKLTDGAVAFPLVVSRKDGKIVTESNSVDFATVGNQAVVDCMSGVMKKMAYDELPEGVSSVTSYRKITVKDGVIVEDWLGPHETVDENAKPPTR